jgi:flagellar biogenesis protein FliO
MELAGALFAVILMLAIIIAPIYFAVWVIKQILNLKKQVKELKAANSVQSTPIVEYASETMPEVSATAGSRC